MLKRFFAVCAALVLLLGFSPAVAVADDPTFNLSINSSRPGREVVISQGDPCPAVPQFTSQYVAISFTDAANTTINVEYALATGGSGHGQPGVWDFSKQFYIPLSAAQGAASFQAYCFIPGQPGHTLDYAPQSYTVTGAAPELVLSKEKYRRGEAVHIEPDVPCPFPSTYVSGTIYLGSPQVFISFNTMADSTGEWSADVTLPATYTDPMGGPTIDLPLGTYQVHAECMNYGSQQGRGLRYVGNSLRVYVPYVALGDSYSAGLGTFNYDGASGSCYRALDSYVQFVAEEQGLGTPLFKACSGAVTDDFFNQNPNNGELPQQMHLSDDTDVVTFTISGNDAGFAEIMQRCAHSPLNNGWECSTDPTVLSDLQDRLDALAGNGSAYTPGGRHIGSLEQLLRSVHNSAENAKIFVAGYPELFGDDIAHYDSNPTAPGGATCLLTAGPGATLSYSDAQWINEQGRLLNGIIYDAVQAVRADGIEIYYVPPIFSGHGLCDSFNEWINPVILDANMDPKPESLHPIAAGYSIGYGEAFVAIMNQH